MSATERPGSEAHLAQLGEEKTALKKSQSTTLTQTYLSNFEASQIRSDQIKSYWSPKINPSITSSAHYKLFKLKTFDASRNH